MNTLPGLQRFVDANDREYGRMADFITWITDDQAGRAETTRQSLLLHPGVRQTCLGTKIHHGELSPGCRQCTVLQWSCLFITGRCNGSCFYCPTPQDADDPPMSLSIPFLKPGHYAQYVRRFGFGGASISGGEPFLEFERSLDYIRTLREVCGPDLHLWMYTNGILVTGDRLRRLVAAGLNEIRFDIGATAYNLKQLRQAVGIVPTVTVEIPCVPEERDLLHSLLRQLNDEGVHHLNLHQLRLTPHNARHLLNHEYTYVHGHKVTVLESELLALELVARAAEMRLDMGVNYCSFAFKHRFQNTASRLRFGPFLTGAEETLTGNGYIRTLRAADSRRVTDPAELLPDDQITVAYDAVFARTASAPRYTSQTMDITDSFSMALERRPALAPATMPARDFLAGLTPPQADSRGHFAPDIRDSWEWIVPGLGPYF